eukprot:5383689-Amphidinium_carterae.2
MAITAIRLHKHSETEPCCLLVSTLGDQHMAQSILSSLSATAAPAASTATAGRAHGKDLQTAVEALAKLALRNTSSISFLERATQLEIAIKDERVKNLLVDARTKWESSGEEISLRAVSHSVILLSLSEAIGSPMDDQQQQPPQQQQHQQQRMTTAMALTAKELDQALIRLRPKFHTPRAGTPWIFYILMASTAQGVQLAEFWRSVPANAVIEVRVPAPTGRESALVSQVQELTGSQSRRRGKQRRSKRAGSQDSAGSTRRRA